MTSTRNHTIYIPPDPPQVTDCGVWIAPSTIPGAGMGIFAGRDFAPRQVVTAGDGAIPLVDLPFHSDIDDFTNQFLWDEYTWSAGSFIGMPEEADDVYGASFGIGALPNCLFTQINVDESFTQLDGAGLHRSKDPGAGAFTPYHDRKGVATRAIRAGEELFVDYGWNYFYGSREETVGMIPFAENFEEAYDIFMYFLELKSTLYTRHKGKDEMLQTLFEDIYRLVKEDVPAIWPSRVLSAFPDSEFLQNPDLEDLLVQHGLHVTLEERSRHPMEYLQSHGSCADHLHVRTSTLPQAGRGAFAVRNIPSGHVVAPVPLIHIPNREILSQYLGAYTHTGRYKRRVDQPIHFQLLLNYCFGHAESTLLLCPYGIVSTMINHASAASGGSWAWYRRQKPQVQPNARIQWSSKISRRLDWLEQPLEEWAYTYQAGLAFEYIATRDIAIGEEIFIDYGDAWEEAWQKHVEEFQPHGTPDYKTALEMNEEMLQTDKMPRNMMSKSSSASDHVVLHCREYYRLVEGRQPDEDDELLHECLPVVENNGRHVMEIVTAMDRPAGRYCYIKFKEVLWDVPVDGLVFKDAPYSRDHAQPWAFRHDLRVPDELFPEVWKNKKQK